MRVAFVKPFLASNYSSIQCRLLLIIIYYTYYYIWNDSEYITYKVLKLLHKMIDKEGFNTDSSY